MLSLLFAFFFNSIQIMRTYSLQTICYKPFVIMADTNIFWRCLLAFLFSLLKLLPYDFVSAIPVIITKIVNANFGIGNVLNTENISFIKIELVLYIIAFRNYCHYVIIFTLVIHYKNVIKVIICSIMSLFKFIFSLSLFCCLMMPRPFSTEDTWDFTSTISYT